MGKNAADLKPNFAPVYAAALYPGLCAIFHRHGYALCVHGSLARDFDLVAVPWRELHSDPVAVIEAVTKEFAVRLYESDPVRKSCGRRAWLLDIGFGECQVDLSFFPSGRGPTRALPMRENAASPGAYVECDVQEATHLKLLFPGPIDVRLIPVVVSRSHEGTDAWEWNGDTVSPTLNPSLLFRSGEHVCHSWVIGGNVLFLPDCSHEYAGRIMNLPEQVPVEIQTEEQTL